MGAVSRLREVRALAGFSRIEPYPVAAERVNRAIQDGLVSPLSKSPRGWLPAAEIRGEGIFFRFRNETVDAWICANPELVRRAAVLEARSHHMAEQREFARNYTITPRLLLVHSFSHALIRQISVECGYSASALRERLYVSEADGSRPPMNGVLIYTGSPDSEGSLGGLVRLAEPELLEPIVRRTLDSAGWCGSDPVCIETDLRPVGRARKRSRLPLLPAAARDGLREIQSGTGPGGTCGRCARHFRRLLRRQHRGPELAVLIPDVPKDCPNSERYVYKRLGRELPDPWIVLHSLGLAGHETKIWGEADIVILSEQGVFALEVKGGTVECVNGVWSFSGDFKTFTKRESPWAQAMGSLGAVRQQLHKARPAFRSVLFGFGVVMPYATFRATGPEIIPEVLLDRRSFRQSLTGYINFLEEYWKAEYLRKRRREYRGLTATELREAREILRPDVETTYSAWGDTLPDWMTNLVQLTNEQIRVSRRMDANPRTVVWGAAGSGKSVIALDRARQQSAEGRQVLYLCFNRLLAAHVRTGLERTGDGASVQVHSVHALYRKLIGEAGLLHRLQALDEGTSDFFSKGFPELAAEALCERSQFAWDVLVIDEAQDLLTPEHLDVFDLLLRDGLSRGCWHLFLDPQQNIYSEAIQSAVADQLDGYAPAFDDLYENCRNTRQVAVQTSIVSGIDLPVAGAPDGPESEVHYYSTPEDAVEVLAEPHQATC